MLEKESDDAFKERKLLAKSLVRKQAQNACSINANDDCGYGNNNSTGST